MGIDLFKKKPKSNINNHSKNFSKSSAFCRLHWICICSLWRHTCQRFTECFRLKLIWLNLPSEVNPKGFYLLKNNHHTASFWTFQWFSAPAHRIIAFKVDEAALGALSISSAASQPLLQACCLQSMFSSVVRSQRLRQVSPVYAVIFFWKRWSQLYRVKSSGSGVLVIVSLKFCQRDGYQCWQLEHLLPNGEGVRSVAIENCVKPHKWIFII